MVILYYFNLSLCKIVIYFIRFLKSNPPDAPKQLLETGKCESIPGTPGGLDCENGRLPYLSLPREVVNGPNDLFDYWKRTTPKATKSERHSHTEL